MLMPCDRVHGLCLSDTSAWVVHRGTDQGGTIPLTYPGRCLKGSRFALQRHTNWGDMSRTVAQLWRDDTPSSFNVACSEASVFDSYPQRPYISLMGLRKESGTHHSSIHIRALDASLVTGSDKVVGKVFDHLCCLAWNNRRGVLTDEDCLVGLYAHKAVGLGTRDRGGRGETRGTIDELRI